MITSSLLHPVSTIPSGSAFKTANDKTYEELIFDRGVSCHITGDFSHVLEPIRCHVGLTVGGGASLHATHMGSVQLDIEIGGSVLFVTLSDVLYVPDWNEAYLISWRKIDMLGHFRMVVEDGIITVERKCDHSPLFIPKIIHRCYQVLPLVRHNKIHTAATDFWHPALGHSSTRFWSNATDIYADGSILPKRPSEFFCPACAKCNSNHSVPLSVSSPQSKNPFDLIHSDLLRPFSVESLRGCTYMRSYVEDKTRYSEVNFLHKKFDARRLIKAFCEKVNTQTQIYIGSFRMD